jgi:ribosomal protein L12E/L44/L45/RPP1/RPP2
VQRKAQEILEQSIPEALGRERGAILSRAEMAEAMPTVLRREGERIGGSLRALDAAGAEGPQVSRIVEEARTKILADLKANAFAKKEANALEDAIEALRGYEGGAIRFEGLHDLSSRLGATIRGKQGLEAEALGKFRGLIEAEIERAGDAAASKLGAGFSSSSYREAKQAYAAAKMLDKAIATGVERETANRSVSLTDSIMLASGLVQGGPVGLAMGAAQAYVNNLGRRYGDQAAAYVLREVGRGVPVSQAVGRVVDQVVDQSVQGLLTKAARGAGAVASGTARAARLQVQEQARAALDRRAEEKEFDRRREALLVAPPAPPEGVPPEAAASAQATAEKARTFLQSKMPRAPGEGVGLQPHLSRLKPSAEAQRKFLAYARAVEDPLSVLDALRRGKLPVEGLEALREVYPEMHASVQAKAAELLAEQSKRLGPEEARRIAAVLGVPAGPADAPSFVLAIQAGYAQQAQGGAAVAGKPPARPVNAARAYDLDQQEVE